MDGLTLLFAPERAVRRSLLPVSFTPALPFSLLLIAGSAAWWVGWLPLSGLRASGVGAFHGALVAMTLASATREWLRPASLYAAGLIIAATLTSLSPWGGLIYLLAPGVLAVSALRRPELGALGLSRPETRESLGLGLAVGTFLGGHLLLSAAQTLGYQPHLFPLAGFLPAVAYDFGANILSAECFFRGALFGSWQRRWGFWPAATAATALLLVRYILDPALPRTLEVTAGAVFYLALLNLSGCALFLMSGSLIPSAAASFIFFAAYRSLSGGNG